MSLSSPSYAGSKVMVALSQPCSLNLHSPPTSVAASGSTPSQQISPSTSPLKRKHSRISVNTPTKTTIDRAEMSPTKAKTRSLPYPLKLNNLPPYDASGVPEPPSPVPTEIIDIEGEDFVRTAKQYGVKVRDFAYEDPKAGVPAAAEIWRNPFLTLLSHDMHIRRPLDPSFELSGKLMRRLLDVGLVTEEEAKRHWTPVDWQRLKVYDEKPHGPYPFCVAMKRPKPSRSYRVAARIQCFGDPLPSDIPDSAIYMPEDGPEVWEGDEDTKEMEQIAKRRKLESERLQRFAALVKPVAIPNTRPQYGPSSQTESSSQPVEYSQTSNPIEPVTHGTIAATDIVATPPTTPVALPEERRSPSRSSSFVNTSSSSSASPSAGIKANNTRATRQRKLGRTETFSLLLVQ